MKISLKSKVLFLIIFLLVFQDKFLMQMNLP